MTYFYNTPLKLNIPKISFKSNSTIDVGVSRQDTFVTNPLLENFSSAKSIEMQAKNNPRIMELMQQYNLPVKVNISELEKLQKGHMKNTRAVAVKIYSALPYELRQQANLKQIQDAAMLHDYGKILIPDKVLNKADALTPHEMEIMQLHPELGYELLKGKGVDEKTLELVKYHHRTPDGRGYPAIDSRFKYDINLQVVNVADKYTALTEDRCYKKSLPKEDALKILSKEVEEGLIKPEVFKALKSVV